MAKYLDEAGLAKSFQLIKEYAVPKSGGTITGNLTVEGTTTVQTPVNDTDAATKAYVDAAVEGASSSYTLPVASAETLGGIKVGNNLTITEDGTLSAQAGETYTLPAATASTLGGVMVGDGLAITDAGVLSVSAKILTAEPTTSDLAEGEVAFVVEE